MDRKLIFYGQSYMVESLSTMAKLEAIFYMGIFSFEKKLKKNQL